MPTYIVHLTTTAQTSVEVEAGSRAEAEQIALGTDTPTLCHQCAGGYRGAPELTLGDEWDVSEVTTPDED